jgi:hypothetical protein
MNRLLMFCALILVLTYAGGCSYFQKKDIPPPLPPIVEKKPPLKVTAEHFKSFPWDELPEPSKEGSTPNTSTYVMTESDTPEKVAEQRMGDPALAEGLARYNGLSPTADIPAGETITIPDPIIGVSSQIVVKHKGEKAFGEPQTFDVEFKKGDRFKMLFEPNVYGYCYIILEGAKGNRMLYPTVVKSSRNRNAPPVRRESGKVRAHDPIAIPSEDTGYRYNPQRVGDKVHVFLSLRKIPELESVLDKKDLEVKDFQDVMQRVPHGEILNKPPITLLRISDPGDILGFTMNLGG